jgi:hypothetical protein
VGRAVDEIALIEIIRPDPAHQELVDERFLDFHAVVHAAEQHALVAERDAGVGEAAECVAHFGGEFARVVGVDRNEERVVFFQHRAEFRSDALGQENRDARADADELDVRDGPQPGENPVEPVIGKSSGSPPESSTSRTSV